MKHTRWTNIYKIGGDVVYGGDWHLSKEEAEKAAAKANATRVACLKIDFEEGQGLESLEKPR